MHHSTNQNGLRFEIQSFLWPVYYYIMWILSLTTCIVLGKRPYPCKRPSPNLDSLLFFRVLRVTAHHVCVMNLKVGPLSHDITHQRFAHTHLLPCSQHSSLPARNLHTVSDNWMLRKLSNEAISQSALLHDTAFSTVGLASMKHGWTDDASWFCPMAANFASWVGPCVGIVEPFKHLPCVTAHPQIFLGQYSTLKFYEDNISQTCKQLVAQF